jgi:hypothetical protein
MTDALSLDDIEYEVTHRYRYNTVVSTVVTYKNFDVLENREVRWDANGRYGPGLYYVVPLRETFADVVTHNSRMLGPHLPPSQETVVPTQSVEQVQEKTYHHNGQHHTEPALRRRKYLRYRSHSEKNPTHTGKPNHRSRSPDELEYGYYQKYEFGISDNDRYYRSEMIDYHDYYNQDYDTQDYYTQDYYDNYDYNFVNDDDDYDDDDDDDDDYDDDYDGNDEIEECANCGEQLVSIRKGVACRNCLYPF